MAQPEDTTDKMFPPAEGGVPPERPLPLQPSLRSTFIAHHAAILEQFGAFRKEMLGLVDARLKELAEPKPANVGATLKNGALAGLRYGGVALALGEVAAQLAHALGHPELEGPIRFFLKLGGAP